MPLLHDDVFEPLPPPRGLKEKEEVFVVPHTGEVFRNYDDFFQRIILVKSRVWTCSWTGKSGLTFEEACESEDHAAARAERVRDRFPPTHLEATIRRLHHATENLGTLVDAIYDHFTDVFMPGEVVGFKNSVMYSAPSQRLVHGRVVRRIRARSEEVSVAVGTEGKNRVEGESVEWEKKLLDEDAYEVEPLDGDGWPSQVLPFSVITRKKHPTPKALIKSFLREEGTRNELGFWEAKTKYIERFGLPWEPSEEQRATARPSRKRKMESVEEFRERIRRCIKEEGLHPERGDRMDLFGELRKLEREEKMILQELELERDGPNGPVCDDHLVPRGQEKWEPPPGCTQIIANQECTGDFLSVWDFFATFSYVLGIAPPFSMADLESSLLIAGEVTLCTEIHMALLRALLNNEPGGLLRRSRVSPSTWVLMLKQFLKEERQHWERVHEDAGPFVLHEVQEQMKTVQYAELSFKHKLAILKFMCDEALDSPPVRKALDDTLERMRQRQIEIKEEKKELREKMKEAKKTKNGKGGSKSTSAEHEGNDGSTSNLETDGSTLATRGDGEDQTSTNGKRIQELETEIAGLVVRTKPLGLDRDYRRYWFFEQDGRVFVEDPATKMWRFYSEWDEIEEVYRGLDGRGVRERALKTALDSSRDLICAGLQRKQGEEEERRATRRSRSAPSVRWRNKFC